MAVFASASLPRETRRQFLWGRGGKSYVSGSVRRTNGVSLAGRDASTGEQIKTTIVQVLTCFTNHKFGIDPNQFVPTKL